MAISIDRVYKTVQRILNVEQRGQLPSDDFNHMANLSQLDLFHQIFYDEPHFDLNPKGSSNVLPEKIHQMREVFVSHSFPLLYQPSTTLGQTGFFLLPEDLYMLEEVYYQPSEVVDVVTTEEVVPEYATTLDTASINGFYNDIVSVPDGDNFLLEFGDLPGASYPPELTAIGLENGYDHTTSTTDFWLADNSNTNFNIDTAFRILTITGPLHADGGGFRVLVENFSQADEDVLVNNLAGGLAIFSGVYTPEVITPTIVRLDHNPVIAEHMNHKGSQYIKNSKLTAPTILFPKYERFSSDPSQPLNGVGRIQVYPDLRDEHPGFTGSLFGTVQVDYIRKPGYGERAPKWVGMDVYGGTELFDLNNSTDFELHQAMEHMLIKRILFYAGISIREEGIAQVINQVAAQDTQQDRN